MIAVFGIVGTAYGDYLLFYHLNKGNGLFIPALVLLIFGGISLLLFIVLFTISYFQHKRRKKEQAPLEADVVEEKVVEPLRVKTEMDYTPLFNKLNSLLNELKSL